MILKKFKINIHPPITTVIKEVIWCPPMHNWIKGNSDGSSTANFTARGVIFRNCDSKLLLWLAENHGSVSSLHDELMGAIRAIENAFQKGWHNFWLESDSSMVVLAFNNDSVVP